MSKNVVFIVVNAWLLAGMLAPGVAGAACLVVACGVAWIAFPMTDDDPPQGQ